MKTKLVITILIIFITSNYILSQDSKQAVNLPKLTVEQKWETAEGNLVYFVISGISYAKSKGETPEDFGAWAGKTGCPYWQSMDSMSPAKLVQEISANKQQFKDFQMEILEANKSTVKGRMKGFGNNLVVMYNMGGVTEDDYIRFFNKKWVTIANCVGLEYNQNKDGEWVYFSVSEKK